MKLHIREFQSSEYSELIRLWQVAGLAFKGKGRDAFEKIHTEAEGRRGVFFVALHQGQFIGSVLATHDGRKGWINRLAVHPEYRRRGIAGDLVEHAEKWLTHQGIEIFACLVEDGNDISLQFFKKIGYQEFRGIHYLTKRIRPEI